MRLRLPLAALGGVAVWSATEYGVHRWAMHGQKGRNPWSEEHLDHHARPYRTFELKFDRNMLWKALGVPVVGIPVAAAVGGRRGVFTGLQSGLVAGVSFSTAYASYTHLHHFIHHEPPRTALGRRTRKRHLAHHFSTPRLNFGVTAAAAVWDPIGRTRRIPDVVKVPRRLAPPWMVDAHGELLETYAGDYLLAGRRRNAPPVADPMVAPAEADLALALADSAPALN